MSTRELRLLSHSLMPRALPRHVVGIALLVAGLALYGRDAYLMVAALAADPIVGRALSGGMLAAMATALGTLPVLFARPLSARTQAAMLGFGAGVMLAATAFSLVIPGLDAARALWDDPWIAGGVMVAGILAGGGALLWLDGRLPHEHFLNGAEGVDTEALARVWLFVFAIALHNLPEGLAIGVAAAKDGAGAAALAMGIAIQDIPEGLVVALALRGAGYRAGTAALVGTASGLVEPVAAVLGASLIQVSAIALPWGLALAAGAMLLVVSHEIIPESHRSGHEGAASKGLLIGFCVMMLLDTALA